jgi:hypothetical protein
MPKFVRSFIKAGILYLVGSLLIGVSLAGDAIMPYPSFKTTLFPTYLHLFMVGWVTQIIFGVSIWMFPSPPEGGRYGNESIIWLVFWTFNLGLVFRLIAEPGILYLEDSIVMNMGMVLSSLLQWIAVLAYTYHIWGRVRSK